MMSYKTELHGEFKVTLGSTAANPHYGGETRDRLTSSPGRIIQENSSNRDITAACTFV